MKLVVIPKENEKDLAEVPANVLKALKIVFVEHMDEVLDVAFAAEAAPAENEAEREPAAAPGASRLNPVPETINA
jgi:ATP-dependent Lon protease